VVLFEDEFSLSNTATLSTMWSPKGKQPEIDCKQAKKERVTGFGTINPLSGQLVASFARKGNANTFKKHLKKVLRAYIVIISSSVNSGFELLLYLWQ
jgi:hypothetical protein